MLNTLNAITLITDETIKTATVGTSTHADTITTKQTTIQSISFSYYNLS